ncbi:MAG: hypothetical protein GC157_10145 [Frankiales bacterium]|nr:hypothetical protein [Frankiales bacterium]
MDDVLFVRELADGRDLVYAVAADGEPLWALDQDTGLQWWYADRDRDAVRRRIAAERETFTRMPVMARSGSAGAVSRPRHPALELSRRTSTPVLDRPAPPGRFYADDPAYSERPSFLRTPAGVLLIVCVGMLLAGLVLTVLGGGSTERNPVGDDSWVVPSAPQTAGDTCDVRGEIAHDTAGGVLVCAPLSRVTPSELVWRAAG